jgi:hypothetical protein
MWLSVAIIADEEHEHERPMTARVDRGLYCTGVMPLPTAQRGSLNYDRSTVCPVIHPKLF